MLKSIAVVEGNGEFAKETAEYLKGKGYSIAGVTDEGDQGLEIIRRSSPDVIILGMVLKGIDGLEFLDKLREIPGRKNVIVTGNFSDDAVVSKVLAKGAKYYLMKPVQPEVIAARVAELAEEEQTRSVLTGVKERRSSVSLNEKISTIFISMGIPASIKGYSYLREGIKMAVQDPAIINNITKQLYPKIAEKFSTTASKVDRAIRHSIEVAFNKGRIDAINQIFGVRVYIGTEKPTNSEFIALLADKLLLESVSST